MAWAGKKLRHGSNGLLILDEHGFDRLVLGAPVPDPNVGKRNGPFSGLAVYDSRGFERGGYGMNNVGGQDRMLTLDYAGKTGEAAMLSVFDSGPDRRAVGLTMWGYNQRLYLGTGDAALMDIPGGAKPFNGFMLVKAGK